MSELPRAYQLFLDSFPDVARAYEQLGGAVAGAGPLDPKTQHLIKLGMAIASGQEGGAHAHARKALQVGATRDELFHAALLGVTTLGFPQANTGLCWVRDVVEPAGSTMKREPPTD